MHLCNCLARLGACQRHSVDGIHGVDFAGGNLGACGSPDSVCRLHDEGLERLATPFDRAVGIDLEAIVDVPACISWS